MEQAVEKITNLSRSVAEQHATMEAAFAEERAAEEDLLEKLVDAVRPALKALSSRIRHRRLGQTVGLGAAQPGYSDEETFYLRDFMLEEDGWTDGEVDDQVGAAVRGVLVAAGTDHETTGTGTRTETGQKLYLLADSRFAVATFRSQTTQWRGRRDVYEVERWRILSPAEVVADWELDQIAKEVCGKLQAQLNGKAGKTTASARQRAEKLRAVAALLGGRG